MKKLYTLLTALLLCTFVWGESNYCGYPTSGDADYSKFRKNGKSVVFSWNTADNGDVVVTIAPGEGTTTATFRNAGFEGDISKFTVLSGEGFATSEPASQYFEEIAEIGKVNSYTLYRKGGYNLPSPCKIKFTDAAVAWRLNDTNDEYCVPTFIYNYGTLCGSTLDAPSISINSDGEVSFSAVSGADSYKAYVYSGSQFIGEFSITSGQKVWNPYLTGEYAIYVRAFNSSTNAYSDFSNGAIWNAIGNANGDLPPSSMHNFLMKNGAGTDVYVSMSTDLATGNVYITISAVDPANEDYAYWCEDGVRASNLKYNEETFTNYFSCAYGNPVPSQTKTLVYMPKTTGDHIPTYGGVISFNGQTVWNYGNPGYTWNGGVKFKDYIYGTGLGTLSRPIISDFTSAGVITFDAVPGATSYKALVYSSDKKKMYEQVVTSGSTVNYHPYLTDTYKVYLQAFSNDDFSAVSASVDWNLEGNLAYLPQSEWCETIYHTTSNNSEDVNVKWETDSEGNIKVTLTPVEGNQQSVVTGFRNRMNVDNLKIGESSLSSYFTSSYSGNVNTFTLIDPASKPAYGTTITYNGMIEYRTGKSDGAYPNMLFEYVYGTNCETYNDHVNPTITTLNIVATDVTSVTLHVEATDEDDAGTPQEIASYSISSANHGFITQMVTPDESGNFTVSGLVSNKTYTFTVHAIDAVGLEGTRDIEVVLPFNTNYNLSLQGTATDGFHEDTQTAAKAIDGDATTKWNSYGVETNHDPYVGSWANNWMRIDLGAAYNLRNVTLYFDWIWSNVIDKYVIEGSLDDTNWYILKKVTDQSSESADLTIEAPAQYVRFRAIKEYALGIKEFEIYASGFSTLTDNAPVITWTKLGAVDDATAEIEIDAVDITTKPVTKYVVSGIGEDPIELTASEGNITLTSLSQSTHYTVSIQAKDESGNLSAAKEVEFTTTGSVSGLYLHSGLYGWEYPDERERFTATAVEGVYHYAANFATGNHVYKIYNASTQRCTWDACGAGSDHHFGLKSATEVSFYATDEDHMVCSADTLYLRGSLVGEDQELTWNDSRTIATWTGTVDLSGTKQFTLVKKLRYGTDSYSYDHDIYSSVQTFDGSYTQAVFTFDVTKMQGVWAENKVNLTLSDNADNAENISNVNTRLADVTLNRGFIADGGNYTLVLPFDMTAEQCEAAFGAGYQLWYLSDSRIKENGDIYLNFVSTSSIVAGRPYLFCPATDVASGTVISDVHINSTLAPSVTTQASFIGTYDVIPQATISITANAYLLGGNDWLYAAEYSSWDLKALRAYFTLNFTPVNGVAPRIRVVYNESGAGVSTDLDPLTAHPSPLTVTKLLRNGQLIIIRNGVEYNAQGQIIK